ncbi:hypothetical protein [Sphingosinicella rhizophila]|uniref:Adhesin n=1 Tax=Sphingosinicella rhizophila TaxID=3050082 RepID=A0ABU3Q7R9_9SPHN|nr:hypothetical protein [Sphingosinicella sp. GR2756]MDT9598990.1 hypothetical protein [Sphingosinicella sp. GR2756]
MRKHILMAGVAVATLAGGAQAQSITGSLDASLTYENELKTSINTHAHYEKNVSLEGDATFSGDIAVDSSAVAIVDDKQLLGDLSVEFREETPVADDIDETNNPDNPGDGLVDDPDGTLAVEPADIGYFASVINDTSDIIVEGNEGNLGINMAAGYFNQQENVAALASSDFDDADGASGWAEASLTVAQGAGGLYYGPDDDTFEDEAVANDYRDRNIGGTIDVTNGAGNAGLNLAAGAFNQQKNALVVAVATNAALAEANAGVIQASLGNNVVSMNSRNYLSDITIAGNAGNVGVNAAAGVGNQQLNALVIAASMGGTVTPGPTPGPTPEPTPVPTPENT